LVCAFLFPSLKSTDRRDKITIFPDSLLSSLSCKVEEFLLTPPSPHLRKAPGKKCVRCHGPFFSLFFLLLPPSPETRRKQVFFPPPLSFSPFRAHTFAFITKRIWTTIPPFSFPSSQVSGLGNASEEAFLSLSLFNSFNLAG